MYLFHRVLNTESSHKYNQFPPFSNRTRNRPLHYKWYNYRMYDVLVLLTLLLILLLPLCHGSIFLSSHCLIAKNVSDVADVLINWSYFCFRNKITLTFFPMSIFPVLCLCQNYDLWNRSNLCATVQHSVWQKKQRRLQQLQLSTLHCTIWDVLILHYFIIFQLNNLLKQFYQRYNENKICVKKRSI